MTETADKDAQSTPEEEIWGAISAFEQAVENNANFRPICSGTYSNLVEAR